ncbi:MAG TPA: DinB family protein [Puia sp.]|nr:DinB family protein [Puia sp.]
MKSYLIDTFKYNDATNKKLLTKIAQLKDKSEAIKFFSHLINSQYKWMARINQDPDAPKMSWWDPVYREEELEKEWTKSLNSWLDYIDSKTEKELDTEVSFIGFDGTWWAATPKDIALQLNYHSIHHRAQMQTLIRQQGLEPDFIDYIGTKYRKLGDKKPGKD